MAKDTFARKRITVIGGGHMGSALAQGLVNAGVPRSRITVSDNSRGNLAAAKSADWIFLAVKPSVVVSVLADITGTLEGKTIISLAAGVSVKAMKKRLHGVNCSIARIMPNIPVAYGEGVIGFYSGLKSCAAWGECLAKQRGALPGFFPAASIRRWRYGG